MDYKILKPQPGYIVLKEIREENKTMIKSGFEESRAIGKIIAANEKYSVGSSIYEENLKVGDLVVYNEYEGQELFKFGPIDEDYIIVIKRDNILLIVEEPILSEKKDDTIQPV